MRKIFLALLLLSTSTFAERIPFTIVSASGVSLAANGFPLTYNVRVKSKIPLTQLIKKLRFEGGYSCGELVVPFNGSQWAFPYNNPEGDHDGLLQFLFIVPEDQPRGIYRFSARLFYGTTEFVLPESDMEIGGPH